MKADLTPKVVSGCLLVMILTSLVYITGGLERKPADRAAGAGYAAPDAHRPGNRKLVITSLPSLPDLRSRDYKDALKADTRVLRSLHDFYNDQYETDRFAIDYSVAEVERRTDLDIPRGDVIDFQLESMRGTFAKISGQSWGPQTWTFITFILWNRRNCNVIY